MAACHHGRPTTSRFLGEFIDHEPSSCIETSVRFIQKPEVRAASIEPGKADSPTLSFGELPEGCSCNATLNVDSRQGSRGGLRVKPCGSKGKAQVLFWEEIIPKSDVVSQHADLPAKLCGLFWEVQS